MLLAALSFSLSAQGQPTTNGLFATRAASAFALAKTAWAAHPEDASAACHLGQTSYDWSLFATNAEQRAAVAQTGIAACRQWVANHPQSAPGHYYLAMDYGELAEAEAPSLAAYKLIREIEHEFKIANELSNRLDYAGPPRCLGLLYRDAPGWPVSIGNRHKAREYLEQAAALAPDFPENQLNLVESHIHWHQAADAEKAWHKLTAIWPAARTNLTGVDWEVSWDDWTSRRAAVKADYQKTFKKALP
jgi:tetratricopeptide (TPR) repeat protein